MKTSPHGDQRGLGRTAMILLVVIVLALVGAAGYIVMNKKDNKSAPAAVSSTTTAAAKAAEAACGKVYSDKILCKFAAQATSLDKMAYTAVASSTDAQGHTTKFSLKSDGKGNSALSTEGGAQAFDTINIGSTVYVKNTDGNSWTKYGSSAPASANLAKDIKSDFSSTSTPADKRIQYKKLGSEACGKLSCLKYQAINPAAPGDTTYLWFDTQDYRLQHVYSKTSDGAASDFVITYGAVKISVPSPVTDSANADSGGLTQQQMQDLQEQAAQQYGQ